MPRYAPHSLPTGGTRPTSVQESPTGDMEPQLPVYESGQPAVLLAQQIRREHGMQGVRGYIVAMRDYLAQPEYLELCRAMGVSPDIQTPSSHRTPAQSPQQQVMQDSPPVQTQQQMPTQQNGNQMQMLQMLMQLMGGMPSGGMGSGGGFNPMMLAQMLGMQGGSNPMSGMPSGGMGSGGGFNPMMLAQLLGNMQGNK